MVAMGEVATITSKKMVTIPAKIMKRYGLHQGRRVRFVEVEGAVLMVPVLTLTELNGVAGRHAKALLEGVSELERERRVEAARDGQKPRP